MSATLAVRDVEARLSGRVVVTGVTVLVEPGELAAVVGPNGSGKSTLLRAVYRSLRPTCGAVLVDGDDLWGLGAAEAARRVAALTQERPAAAELTVREVVALGRLPYQRPFATLSSADRSAVDDAIERTGLVALAARRFTHLSGGERQRVLLARALAQQTDLVVLDEPTNHLDVRHQLQVLDLVRKAGATTLAAMHDLNLAATYADRVHVLDGGVLQASGTPADVLNPELVAKVFGVRATPATTPSRAASTCSSRRSLTQDEPADPRNASMVFQDPGRALDPVHTVRRRLPEAAGRRADGPGLLRRVGLAPT